MQRSNWGRSKVFALRSAAPYYLGNQNLSVSLGGAALREQTMAEARALELAKKGYLPQSVAARALNMSNSGLSVSRNARKIRSVKFGREIYVLWADIRKGYTEVADLLGVSKDAATLYELHGTLKKQQRTGSKIGSKKQQKTRATKAKKQQKTGTSAAVSAVDLT